MHCACLCKSHVFRAAQTKEEEDNGCQMHVITAANHYDERTEENRLTRRCYDKIVRLMRSKHKPRGLTKTTTRSDLVIMKLVSRKKQVNTLLIKDTQLFYLMLKWPQIWTV